MKKKHKELILVAAMGLGISAVLLCLIYNGITMRLCRNYESYTAAERADMALDYNTCKKYF